MSDSAAARNLSTGSPQDLVLLMLAKNSVPLNQERYGHRKRSFQPEWNSTKLYIYSHVDLSKSAKLADTWVSGIHQGCEVVRIAIMVVYESN